jgi:hypothetical protein
MTYILGMKRHGVTSIIADLRVTRHDTKAGRNVALKSGILFPGAIFGAAGNAVAALNFVSRSRTVAENVGPRLSDKWTAFAELAGKYNAVDGDFQILVASRANGQSELYLYDSNSRILAPADDLTSIGSGRPLLKHYTQNIDQALDKWLRIGPGPDPNECSPQSRPAYFCLGLTEAAAGTERKELERAGVGGVFHYVYQTVDADEYQPPTVFGICYGSNDGETIVLVRFRVAYVDRALIVERPFSVYSTTGALTPESITSLKGMPAVVNEWKELGQYRVLVNFDDFPACLDKAENKKTANRLVKKFKAMEYYRFCGVGFAGSTERGFRMGHERHTTADPFYVNDRGEVDASWSKEIRRRFQERKRYPNEDERTDFMLFGGLHGHFAENLKYNHKRIVDCVQFPDKCLAMPGAATMFRLAWFDDDTAILAACVNTELVNSNGGSRIKIDFAFPISRNLPAGDIDRDTPITDVLNAFARSFCIPVSGHRDQKREFIYSGPSDGQVPTYDDTATSIVLVVNVPNDRRDSIQCLIAFDVDKHAEWFRENVFPTLYSDAKPPSHLEPIGEPVELDGPRVISR